MPPAAYLASWAQTYAEVSNITGCALPEDLSRAPPGSVGHSLWLAAQEVGAVGSEGLGDMSRREFWSRAGASPLRKVQQKLRSNLQRGDRQAWLAEAAVEDQARLHTHSGWAAGSALLRPPTERALRLLDDDVRIAVKERLGVPIMPVGVCSRVFKRSGKSCNLDLRGGVRTLLQRSLGDSHNLSSPSAGA